MVDRFEPYLKNACKRFVMEQKPTFIADDNPNKDINVAFFNLPLTKRYLSFSLFLVFHSPMPDATLMGLLTLFYYIFVFKNPSSSG